MARQVENSRADNVRSNSGKNIPPMKFENFFCGLDIRRAMFGLIFLTIAILSAVQPVRAQSTNSNFAWVPSCSIPVREGPCPTFIAPLVSLIGSPGIWHEKPIVVTGYVRIQFEYTVVFVHRQDYEYGTLNGVWLRLPKSETHSTHACHDRYCMIKGVFDARADRDLYLGTIHSITRMEPVDRKIH